MSLVGRSAVCVALGVASGCALDLDPRKPLVHARFDPEASVVPMPTDVLRDDVEGHLDVPTDGDDLTAAEVELYEFLNGLDGWSTAQTATVELTGPIDTATVDGTTLQVFEWGEPPRLVEEARVSFADGDTQIRIDAPREGWRRGRTYVAMLRGGESGARGAAGETLLCDAAFYFLRLRETLNTPEHNRAFPGRTRAERQDNSDRLEEIRQDLAPFFAFFEAEGVPRKDVAALWSWTVTERVELAMDKASQRMPLPFDLLLDPETHLVDLPLADWDTEIEREAKLRLRDYDGFALSADFHFTLTGEIDPATATNDTVKLYELSDPPREIPALVRVLADLTHVFVRATEQPLAQGTTYAIVVHEGLRAADGTPISPMAIGHFMKSTNAISIDGRSEVGVVDDADSVKVELARAVIAPFLDRIGRGDVITAWPFTTLRTTADLVAATETAGTLGVTPEPTMTRRQTPAEALGEFLLALGGLFEVEEVIHGTIRSPVFLDPVTRAFNAEGDHEEQDIAFTMTIPRGASRDTPLPVVIFNHAIMTERRFVMAIADGLAREGFAAVAIDQPYHGLRTQCVDSSPIAVVDPRTGEQTSLPPCQSGATCDERGRCVDASGRTDRLTMWPALNYPVASGAAFLEIAHIPATKDHFVQALIDTGALARSLREGDWRAATGWSLSTDRLYMAGQSLGGIISATYVPLDLGIERAVLNVPGADLVDMFDVSTWFGPQVDGYFTRERIERDSFDGQRFLDVARWFVDAVDPHSVAHLYRDDGRAAMIQMATLDFIIPNEFTMTLERVSGLPRRDYVAEHGFVVIPVEPEYLRGVTEMATFLSGDFVP